MIASVQEYESIISHDDPNVRRRAILEEADAGTWLALLDNRPDLSSEIAMNKLLPPPIVDQLISSLCCRTRSLVAMKRSLSAEQFSRLASDEDESVRLLVVHNKKAPRALLEQLSDDHSVMVSEAALRRLHALTE